MPDESPKTWPYMRIVSERAAKGHMKSLIGAGLISRKRLYESGLVSLS